MNWETVIGLEIHTQLSTRTKIFSGAPTAYGAEPNTQACPVDLGLPGVLPVLNREAVRMAVKFGLAIDARIASRSVFSRKNYFYPDLPKGYQISQYDEPLIEGGYLDIDPDGEEARRIGITRAHLEEDAGKSLHEGFQGLTGVDLNRAGTPLMEIVSEPELRSPAEAAAYMRKLHTLVRYLEICDGNMQEGSFRCDANVSVRPAGTQELGTRTEVKNLNSFRFVERALEYEVERQIDVLESGGEIVQETRLYDVDQGVTRSMRTKEGADDYRYFPEPDLLPLELDRGFVDEVRETLPELPDEKRRRFEQEYGLPAYDAGVLTATREMADYYERAVSESGGFAKRTANLLMSELLGYLNKDNRDLADSPITSAMLGRLVARIEDGTVSSRVAKDVFEAMWAGEGGPDEVIESKGLKQVTDTGAIEALVDEVLASNPEQLEQYRAGKDKLFGFFVGQVMKASGGKANPQQVNELLKKKLDES